MPGKGDPSDWIRRWLGPGQTAIDVGANVGIHSATMAEQVGATGRVIACDPDARCWLPWRERCFHYPWASLFGFACGEETCYALPFFEDLAGHETSSRYQALLKDPKSVSRIVDQRRLDDLTETADLVKIDAQGADALVLLGAVRLLVSCPYWIVEVWPWGLAHAGSSAGMIWSRLAGNRVVRHAGTEAIITESDAWNYQTRFAQEATKQEHVNWVAERS